MEEGCKGTIHFPLPQSQSASKCSPWHLAERYPSISKDFSGPQRTGGKIVPPLHMDICPEDTALTSQKCNRSDGTAINLTHDFKLINHVAQLRNRMQVPLCPQTNEERSLHFFIHSFLLSINSYWASLCVGNCSRFWDDKGEKINNVPPIMESPAVCTIQISMLFQTIDKYTKEKLPIVMRTFIEGPNHRVRRGDWWRPRTEE